MPRLRKILVPAVVVGGAAGAAALVKKQQQEGDASPWAAAGDRPGSGGGSSSATRTPATARHAARSGPARSGDAEAGAGTFGAGTSDAGTSDDAAHTREAAGTSTSTAPASTEEQHEREVASPRDISSEGWKAVVKRAWKESKADNVPLLAAGVAFYAFIALFPALIALVTAYGLVAEPETVQEQIDALSGSLPESARSLLQEQLNEIVGASSTGLGIGLVVSLAGALFAASSGVQNLVKAVNIAYDEEESRGFVKLRATALLLTVGAVVFVVVAVGLVAVVPAALSAVGLGSIASFLIGVGRFVGLFVFVMLALAIVYRYAPDRDNARFAWTSLGAAVATVLWVVGSIAFSLYVSNFGSYGETYGALAGVIVLLLWLFLTSFIVLLGAEVNAEAERQTVRDTTQGDPLPRGERDAVAADDRAPAEA